ncbi:hypothetical protein M430DRAFT_40094 [Amorphotheca resinae ATCC 22711]|uniref:Ubiquitin-conjugating enzyme E2C-binding protein n=1 Tax=Amorphotheca resinae ATCC 22711 TaxID=857342 RepID=A0A2T3B7N6_AMORE|nr:hypothetical protein M430DRAFT_40094 [Amorphotheca resinae ATCC 22711]PSS22851.1 hypothetical protein M430DRAFT_40094 [Amorphotheca resinae ATCC 22711]
MAEPKPLMYAELLANIRQISVIAALETPCHSSTRVELSADGHQFTLHHEGKTTVLNLPGTTSPNIQLQKPALGAKELSWRLPLVSEPTASSAESSDAPWPAKDLDEDSEFRCRSCAEVVVGKGKVTVWKDLPSENWADMMDFWHCHKPSAPANGDHSHDEASSRGYGANTKFTAQPTVGFVDLTTFLLAESDCRGIEPKTPAEEASAEVSQYQPLICKTCHTYIGHVDHAADGYRLYKWRLQTLTLTQIHDAPSSTSYYYQPSTSSIIAFHLHSILTNQCTSRLLLIPPNFRPSPTPTPSPSPFPLLLLHLWILTPFLSYSTSTSTTPSPSPSSPSPSSAMKLFYRPIHLPSSSTSSSSSSPSSSANDVTTLLTDPSIDEVQLPADTIFEIERALRESRRLLPGSMAAFRGWEVGLLERG